MSLKDKTKKFGEWASDNADVLVIGGAIATFVGFAIYGRHLVKEEEAKISNWLDSEAEKGNRVLPGPDGFAYIIDPDGNQTVHWMG